MGSAVQSAAEDYFRRHWRAVIVTLLIAPKGVEAAGLIPVLDPMYVMVYGANAAAPAAESTVVPSPQTAGASAKSVVHPWSLGTHSIQEFVATNGQTLLASEPEDFQFRPRYVAVLQNGQSVALSGEQLNGYWSRDIYARRTLAQVGDAQVQVLAGIKVAGFNQTGPLSLDDASAASIATMPRLAGRGTLLGPMFGIAGDRTVAKHKIQGVFQQSMLYGETELSRADADGEQWQGGGLDAYVERQNVNVAVSEVGVKYLYELSDRVALGMGAMASVWWGDSMLTASPMNSHDKTSVNLGGMGTLEVRFY